MKNIQFVSYYSYKILLIVTACSMYACSNGSNLTQDDIIEIKQKMWSYDKGFKLGEGDFLTFDSVNPLFQIHNDTIYYKGYSKAIITEYKAENYLLKITSISNGKDGYYTDVAERLR